MKLSHIKFSNISLFLLRNLARIITIITVLFILLGVMGHTVRDRTVELAVLMYIPLLPLGLWAVLWDLFRAGRSLPLFRFGLTVIGLGIMIWGGVSMIGMGGSQMPDEPDKQVSILHWNVYWGGRGKNGWKSISHDIEQRHPDIAILSEPPAEDRLILLLQQMGWQTIMYENTRKNPLAICSSWPLQFERFVRFRKGRGMIVVVTVRGQPLRVLAVDGERNMSRRLVVLSREVLPRLRTPLLTGVVETIEANQVQGQPIDIIAGDFNALSLSRGFDAFAQVGGGYHLASKFSRDWRGTWISLLPLYDIDHVWVHKHFQGLRTEFLTNLKSDHRGQLVQFKVWSPIPKAKALDSNLSLSEKKMAQYINNKPIGILGGTFNPIHHGHLRLALELYERLDLAKVLLIPSAHPPHRAEPSVSDQRRLEMVQAAIRDVEGLSVDDREVRRQGVSYTVDTLDSLREEYPHRPLCLILGMDAFLGLPSWHEWERLITLAHLLVVRRPDTLLPKKHAMQDFFDKYQTLSAEHFKKQTAGMIWMEEIPALAISATQIRHLIATGKNPHYLLPPAVLDIINTHHLYRKERA